MGEEIEIKENKQEDLYCKNEGDTTIKLKDDSHKSATNATSKKQQRRSSLRRSNSSCRLYSGIDNSNTNTGRDISTRSNVSFGSIEVHEFEFELGGSALPSSGPSVVLSRNRSSYTRHESIDDFEDIITKENGTLRGSTNKQPKH